MALQAAIFDCDGTLVDSFAMWEELTCAMLAELGLEEERLQEVFEATEPVPLREMCELWHSDYGLGSSGADIYAELCKRVKIAYATQVALMPGLRQTLKELKSQGIALTCASSTSLPELKIALGAQGIMHYFDHVISTGNGMPDKHHPDIWLHACKLMNSKPEATWVFEDGPYSLVSAAEAGCPTVCIYGDSRDRAECEKLANIVIDSYEDFDTDQLK